ncbi:GNAT family N-acetyltransferase [Flammeovirga kamogawensis]|uniref:GNAT family N-acetyltransferase n=1 Tax=Flammeovirga kamogawensis TaxID=373891 RepID=A0ABX8GRW2_9BACT|nr:GNAT family N-acetyltransferase [Flammeovirga kamogawensis]MBB6462774.1 GNAT superfamily N-acetyltransferase [Flammeovirga kamogawensis]QWG05997.1 GNAT family N-acetyltransferase [Flammeovirga kamogawensis]TRX67826.1 GNAT family N-acetyltransferase [Flammeovirga kamogawensis]
MSYITIPVKTQYLKKDSSLKIERRKLPKGTIKHWSPLSTSEYLKIYNQVGAEWGWTGRVLMSDQELSSWLVSDNCKLLTLIVDEEIAGFIEFDISNRKSIEVAYFGLLPAFIGQKLGLSFLMESIREVEEELKAKEVWLHTCQFDHPFAIQVYQKAGFSVINESIDDEPYEEAFLIKNNYKF